jgi:4-amino-4-deoxy-L-arabinose transferase-like glycosyltransferase
VSIASDGARETTRAARRVPWPVVLAVVALVLRLGLIIATHRFAPNNDPADYDHIARSIANGHGYPPTLLAAPGTPSALRPPGYPLLLALVYLLGGHWLAGRVANALLGVVVVWLVYLIAKVLWTERHGLIAGGLAAIFPPLIALNGSLLSEPLFLVFELLVVWAVLGYQDGRRRLLRAAVIGVLCGAAALTRSVGLLLPIAAIAGLLAAPDTNRRQAVESVTAVLAAMCLTIAPWAIRNASAFHGAFVPVSTQDGITAAGTYNAEAGTSGRLYAVWRPPYLVPAFQHLFGDSVDEAQMDRILRNDAVSYAVAHPGYFLAAIGLDSLRLVNLGPAHSFVSHQWYYEMGVPRRAEAWVSITGDLVIATALLTVVAAGIRARRSADEPRRGGRRRHGFVWLMPVLMYAAVVPIHGGVRYRSPVDPFFVILAAYGVAAASEALRGGVPERAAAHWIVGR